MSTATTNLQPVEIAPENYFTRVFHTNCPNWGKWRNNQSTTPPGPPAPPTGRTSGIMRPLKDDIQIEDGSWLQMWECLHCGSKVYAGIDKQRVIVTKPEGTPCCSKKL